MSQIKDPKKTVAPVDNLLDLQFNPTTNKPKAIKEKDIFDVEKDKKDPKSDRFYPDVALKARQDSMVHQNKMAGVIKTGKKIRAK